MSGAGRKATIVTEGEDAFDLPSVKSENLPEWLGAPRYVQKHERNPSAGLAVGLAWTPQAATYCLSKPR